MINDYNWTNTKPRHYQRLIENLLVTDFVECALRDERADTVADRCLATLHQLSSCGRQDCRSSCSLCSYGDAVVATEL